MERLEAVIDGITFRVKRRKFKSGKLGFMLMAGAIIHGRLSWVQLLVIDRPPLTDEARHKKSVLNRARKKVSKVKAKERKRETWQKMHSGGATTASASVSAKSEPPSK